MTHFIEVYENALSKDTCDSLIELFEQNPDWQMPGRVGKGIGDTVDASWKDSLEIGIDGQLLAFPSWRDHLYELFNSLENCLNQYKTKYPFLDEGIAWSMTQHCNFQKYFPGKGFYQWHCESENNNRNLAWMFYLNTIDEGGGTEFNYDMPNLDAVAGNLAIWPAYWTHYHRGIVAPNQEKYIITGWYNYTA